MKNKSFVSNSTADLEAAGIETARLDIFVLMEDALDIDRAQLLARPELEIPLKTQKVLDAQIARRMTHEPLAYIRGKSEFYGREFIVNHDVLVPRPESETMIDLLKKHVLSDAICDRLNDCKALANLPLPATYAASSVRIADIGSGSGALGITAALEVDNCIVDLFEISQKAIEVTKLNVIKFTTQQIVICSDLLASVDSDYDILLCNLPYVPELYPVNKAAEFEPKLALFAGADGLDIYRRLFVQTHLKPIKPLLILCEALPSQHENLQRLAVENGYSEIERADFIQVFRLV